MGRPSLSVRKTTVRLTVEVLDRIEAIAGKNRTAEFLRAAAVEKLDRDEKA